MRRERNIEFRLSEREDGQRTFTLLVDGKEIGSRKIQNNMAVSAEYTVKLRDEAYGILSNADVEICWEGPETL